MKKDSNVAEKTNLSIILEKFNQLDKECDILLFKIHKAELLKALKESDGNKSR